MILPNKKFYNDMQNKRDPMEMFGNAKQPKIVKEITRKHEEADLHLKFCKWVKKEYPNDQFIRHEREKARSFMMQNLMKCYNSDIDKMPDFELLEPSDITYQVAGIDIYRFYRLYIEFKKPGTILTLKDGITIKTEYSAQYKRHVLFWKQNSPAYFCSDFEEAKRLFINYKNGTPLPMQIFNHPLHS